LIGYLYGITSERKLVEELRMHLAWRRHRHRHSDQENAKCRSLSIAVIAHIPKM